MNWNKSDKVWKTLIHFKRDVFTAVAVIIAKTPYLTVSFRLRSHSTAWIFNQLKNLTKHFVHTKLFNVFALFTQNCQTVLFPSKAINNTTRKSMLAICICHKTVILQLCGLTAFSSKNLPQSLPMINIMILTIAEVDFSSVLWIFSIWSLPYC